MMSEINGFELAVLSLDSAARPIFCFPPGAAESADRFAAELPTGETEYRGFYSGRWWLPLMICREEERWLALRCLLGVAGVMPVIDLDSPRRRRLCVADMPMDVVRLYDRGYDVSLYDGDSIMPLGEARPGDPFGVLAACANSSGSMDTAAECICALADIMGCGLELTCPANDAQLDVDTGTAAAIGLHILMLCLRAGADRRCRMAVERREDEAVFDVQFALCPDELLKSSGEECPEITACRRLAEAHNASFELKVVSGGVQCRFCPACREWSRLGIKHPAHLEYD